MNMKEIRKGLEDSIAKSVVQAGGCLGAPPPARGGGMQRGRSQLGGGDMPDFGLALGRGDSADIDIDAILDPAELAKLPPSERLKRQRSASLLMMERQASRAGKQRHDVHSPPLFCSNSMTHAAC